MVAATGLFVQWRSWRLLAILGFAAVSMAVASASMLLVGLAVIGMLPIPPLSSGIAAVVGLTVVALVAGMSVTLRHRTDRADFLQSMGKLNRALAPSILASEAPMWKHNKGPSTLGRCCLS